MDDLKQLAAMTALNEMLAGSHFSICTIDRVATLLAVNPKGEAYDTLHTLHCIHYDKMPARLRDAIPELIRQCLGVEAIYRFTTLQREVIEVAPERKRGGFMRLLGGGR